MQMQKYKKNVLRPNIWQFFFFTDMTDVDDVFTRWLFLYAFDCYSIILRFAFAISLIPKRRTSEGTMTALW